MAQRYPEVEGLFTWPSDTPQLIGARCGECTTTFFPAFAEFHRPGCSGSSVEEVLLGRRGTLVSFTVQRYTPPPPFPQGEYEPAVLGTVVLEEGIQVPGQVVDCGPDDIEVGMDVELVVDTLYVDDAGNDALTWAFRVASSKGDGGES